MERNNLIFKTNDNMEFALPVEISNILGFVTEGIQKEFIVRSGLGLICEPDSVEGSVSTLVQLLKSGREFRIDKDYIESFRRKNITRKLADLIRLFVE